MSGERRKLTFVMVKPDGVQRGFVGKIIKRFEQKGFKLVAMKLMVATEDRLVKHYPDLYRRPNFAAFVEYMTSAPVVPMIWEGDNVIKTARTMLIGKVNKDPDPGTIRGDFSSAIHPNNIMHGSDSKEEALKEINIWFEPDELVSWKSALESWI